MSTILTIPDADVLLYEGIESPLAGTSYFQRLHKAVEWRTETITLFGKTHLQPRLIAFYGDQGVSYTYSRRHLEASGWIPVLHELKTIAEDVTATRYNCVLANLYRNERDSMGMHSDDEPELGNEPVIVSMSFGQTRTLLMKHRTRKDLPSVRIPLTSESILVMRGTTQQHWLHGIEKKTRSIGPRINLTFRLIKT